MAIVAAACLLIIAVAIRPRVITAPAKISLMDEDSTVSILAAWRLSKQLLMLSWKPVTPAAVQATLLTVQQLQANHDAALAQWRLEVERLRHEAERAERRYRTVEPENRLVARGLENAWEACLRDLAGAEAELRRQEQQRPSAVDPKQLQRIQTLGADLRQVWKATSTSDRDRKELLRLLLEEVSLNLKRAEGYAHLTLRWRGGAITVLDVPVPRFRPMGPRTDEDTIRCCAAWPRFIRMKLSPASSIAKSAKPRPANASRPTRSGVCAAIATSPASNRRLNHRQENWRRFGRRHRFLA